MYTEKLLDHYIVLKTLGRGRFSKIKAVKTQDSKSLFAAKIYFSDSFTHIANHEASLMRTLSNSHIVQVFELILNGTYYHKDGSSHSCVYLLMELCSNSDLFNLAIPKKRFSTNLVKYIFHEILSAVATCHQQQIFLSDLKPQNVLFDENFSVKLTDFGAACTTLQTGAKAMQPGPFTAPEAGRGGNLGEAGDVFALGAILFYLLTQSPPFHSVGVTDVLFRVFVENPEEYWRRFAKMIRVGSEFFERGFKELVQGMMNCEPNRRMSLGEVIRHEWLRVEGFGVGEVMEEIGRDRREAEVLLELQKEKRKGFKGRFGNYRGEESESFSWSMAERVCKDLEKESFFYKFTQVRSALPIKTLFGEVLQLLSSVNGQIEIKEDLQVKCEIFTEEDNLELKAVVYKMEEYSVVEFKLIQGCYLELTKLVIRFIDALSHTENE